MTTLAESKNTVEYRVKMFAKHFQMLPKAAIEALRIAENPEASIDEFSAAIERDIRLAAEILSIANSSLFCMGKSVDSVQAAVSRLGLRQCKNIMYATCMASMIRELPVEEAAIREILWGHNFLTGVIARHLNQELRLKFNGEEFTAGLMHDIGRSLLAAAAPVEFCAGDGMNFNEDQSIISQECEAWGTDHCAIGAWFAEENGLPESIIESIRYHHAPQSATKHSRLVTLIATADHMANHLDAFGPAEPYDAKSNPYVELLLSNDLQKDQFVKAGEEITQQEFVDACKSLMP